MTDTQEEHEQPLVTWVEASPFVGVAVVGLLAALVPFNSVNALLGLLAALSVLAIVAAAITIRTAARHSWTALLAPALLLLVIGVARQYAQVEGVGAGLSPLIALPVLWVAMTGTRKQLIAFAVGSAAVFWVPAATSSTGSSAVSEWRLGALWLLVGVVVAPVVQDLMTKLHAESASLREAHAMLASVGRSARLSSIIVADPEGRVESFSSGAEAMLGYQEVDVLGQPAEMFHDTGELAAIGQELGVPSGASVLHALARQESSNRRWTYVRADGGRRQVLLALTERRDESGDTMGFIGVAIDVTEAARAEAALGQEKDRLSRLADHDALTGLPNRRKFELELRRHLQGIDHDKPRGGLLLLDLDRFKDVNDTLGHEAGDDLLVSVAQALRTAVRPEDVVARLGGDEFAVLVVDGGPEVLERIADDLVAGVAGNAAGHLDVRRNVRASVGAVTVEAALDHELDILVLADLAMYDAKDAGRNQYALMRDPGSAPQRYAARLAWRSRIETALAEDRLELLVQPILDLHDDVVRGGEALVRLRQDEELVSPAAFIPVAERMGLMPQIDTWVIEHAIALAAELRQHRPEMQLHVNVSARSMDSPGLETLIHEALTTHDVPPSAIVLELTETAALADLSTARAFTTRIRELGCGVALDDFGVGYGSYTYLKELSLDGIKIDGSFVRHAVDSSTDRAIIGSIAALAHELGKRVTAEYVHDEQTLALVREHDIDQAQGYVVGEPMAPAVFTRRFLAVADGT